MIEVYYSFYYTNALMYLKDKKYSWSDFKDTSIPQTDRLWIKIPKLKLFEIEDKNDLD